MKDIRLESTIEELLKSAKKQGARKTPLLQNQIKEKTHKSILKNTLIRFYLCQTKFQIKNVSAYASIIKTVPNTVPKIRKATTAPAIILEASESSLSCVLLFFLLIYFSNPSS